MAFPCLYFNHEVIAVRARLSAVLIVFGLAVMLLLSGCMFVNSPPVASFTRTPSSGAAPLNVTFSAVASRDPDGIINSYVWNFGDSGTGAGISTSHIYQSAGTYTAVLRITDDDGDTDTASQTITVTAAYTPPVTPPYTPPASGADYSVSAGTILDEFEANEIAATLKYQNKTIAVSGYVQSIGMSIMDRPYVTLIRSAGLWTLREVWCYFPSSYASSLTSLREGDYVTIVGDFDDYMFLTVWLEDCRLL